jgi:gamma-glutamyl hercynylcysteine S-oxide synthase
MTQTKTASLPVRIASDRPAVENLVFGFDGYAETLAGLIAGKTNVTPFVMGIHGSRGAGKTTLMKAIKSRLDGDPPSEGRHYRRCKTAWFQAWKYNDRDDILAALIETIFKAMAADGFFSLARTKIDTVTRRFDKSSIYASISKLATSVDISDFFSGPAFREELGFSETFQRFFDDLVWTFINWRFKLTGQEKPDDRMGAMVIFIDDLDRCRPGRIVRALETIKLYMNRSGCIFVLGACRETLYAALNAVYGPEEGRGLLEKVIQVGFTIPRNFPEAFVRFLEESPNDGIDVQALETHLPLIIPALGHNPRQFKRLVNGLNLLCGLLSGAKIKIEFDKVLAWWMVTCLFEDLSADIKDSPDRLAAIRETVRRLTDKYPETPVWQLSPDQLAEQSVPESLGPCLQRKHLAEIVMKLDLTDHQFRCLSTLSGSVVLPGKTV